VHIPNGVSIAAAIAEGFQIKRDGKSPNAFLNISAEVANEQERDRRLAR
jgi:hypothetical protein